jgi:hypothetical protein
MSKMSDIDVQFQEAFTEDQANKMDEVYALFSFFKDSRKAIHARNKGWTVEKINEVYANMPSDWVWALIS